MDMFSHEIYSMNIDTSTHHNIVKSVNWVYKMRRDNFIINATMTTELDPPVGNTISYANLNEAIVFQWVSEKVVINDLKLAMTERMNEICKIAVFNRLPPWNLEFNNQRWSLVLDELILMILGTYSFFFKDLVQNMQQDSVLVLIGFHLESFQKIYQFMVLISWKII